MRRETLEAARLRAQAERSGDPFDQRRAQRAHERIQSRHERGPTIIEAPAELLKNVERMQRELGACATIVRGASDAFVAVARAIGRVRRE